MNDILASSLTSEFPNLFLRLRIEIGDGWHGILKDVCLKLDKDPTSPRFLQIKEKFGRLTIYLDKYSKESDLALKQAYSESERTCEDCGSPSEIRNIGYWIKSLCLECHTQIMSERSK